MAALNHEHSVQAKKITSKSQVAAVVVAALAALLLAICFTQAWGVQKALADEPLAASSVRATSDADTVDVGLAVTFGQTEARSMLTLMNDFRKSDDAWAWNSSDTEKVYYTNLIDLQYDYELERVAMQRAAEIALHYSHTRPDGKTKSYNMLTTYSVWAENIAAGYSSASAVFEGWQETNDPYSGQGHRRNMLTSSCTHVGIGHAVYSGTHYWVQVFATPGFDSTPTTANDSSSTATISVAKSLMTVGTAEASPSSITMTIGDSTALPSVTASVQTADTWPARPRTASVPDPSWSVSDSSVAAIENGMLVAKSAGTVTLSTTVSLASDITLQVPVEVKKPNVENATITLSQTEYTYDGAEKKPSATVVLKSKTLTTSDYEVTYLNNVNAGTAKAVITGKGNYEGQVEVAFSIVPQTVSVPVAFTGLVYNGANQTGVAGTSNVTVSGGAATNAGNYAATATLADPQNFVWEDGTTSAKTVSWSISPKSAVVTSNDATKTYGETDPAFTATVEGLIGADSIEYSFTRVAGEDAGIYAITPNGAVDQGNYTVQFRANGKLTITKANSSISLADQDATYAGSAISYTGEVTRSGSTGNVTLTYYSDANGQHAIDPASVVDADVYYVKAELAGDANHEGAVSNIATLVVSPKPITVNVAGKRLTTVYNGMVQAVGGYTVEAAEEGYDLSNVVGPEEDDKNMRSEGTDVGTYELWPSTIGFLNIDTNYKVTFSIVSPVSLTITPAPIDGLELVLDTPSEPIVYDGEAHKPAITVVGGEGLREGVDYAIVYEGADDSFVSAGDYTIYAKGKGNYQGETNKVTYSIAKAPSSIQLSDAEATYSGSAQAYNGKITTSGSSGKVTYAYYSDAACKTAVAAANVKNAATYYVKATLAADANYEAATSAAAKLVVNKAAGSIAIKPVKATQTAKAKKNTTIAAAKAFKVTKNTSKGTVSYARVKGDKKITIAKNGKVTIKKGLKKGKTYTVTVKATAAATTNYKAATSATVTLKIKVK